jgi:hypothetical protein
MEHFTSLRLIRTITQMLRAEPQRAALGRWNLRDREDIKGSLANMDCCGDDLCGSPEKYKEKVSELLKYQSKK